MKRLKQYINEAFNISFKLNEDDRHKLIELDRKYHTIITAFKHEHVHFMNVANIKEQVNNIIECVKNNKDFDINLKYENSKFSDENWCNQLIDKSNNLIYEFNNLENCYITKFYLNRLNVIIKHIIFLRNYCKDNTTFPELYSKPSKKLYDEAIKILQENKFIDVHNIKDKQYERVFTPEESQKRLQKIIDKLGYDWKVIIDDNMIPRMSVRPYKEFRISSHNKFSEIDLQSLEVHEIQTHVARKYYGLLTGLYLFLYGLTGYNIYDEGCAIYNSLHKLKTPKPNILWYTAIKVVMFYHLDDMSNLELFKFCKSLTNVDDNIIALSMVRIHRNFCYSLLSTATSDTDYLKGYLLVKEMTENERNELLKYNIGPEQIYELNNIKKFLELNKFNEIEYNESNYDDYEDHDIEY